MSCQAVQTGDVAQTKKMLLLNYPNLQGLDVTGQVVSICPPIHPELNQVHSTQSTHLIVFHLVLLILHSITAPETES